ncbi:hypothetical protein SDC9_126484 [bioreactor metagenome]|uniref:Uncharacterized protein n=1 Tax=bioreactor metagenome TaxID=1076179 RepID=A0A645CQS6_9ZZZZ
MLKSVHDKRIVIASVVGFADESGDIVSVPFSNDGSPSAQGTATGGESPVEHFIDIVIRSFHCIHAGRCGDSVWQLNFV